MKKALYLLAAFTCYGTIHSVAQTQITHLSGTQTLNGVNVTVTPSSPNTPNSANFCNTGPYQIGKNYSDYYEYTFNAPVTHLVFEMVRIHDDDTVQIDVNGTKYNLAATNFTAYTGVGNCAMTSNVTAANGLITTTAGATGIGQGVTVSISIPPTTLITSCRVTHLRHSANNLASDVIYNAYFEFDTCKLNQQGFIASVTKPLCTGKDAQLTATFFPNTIYSWSTTGTAPTYSPSSNVHDPFILNLSPVNSGTYTVTATRGICQYTASVSVPIGPTPSIGVPVQTGPECPGADDTIKLPTLNLAIGGTVYAYGTFPGSPVTFDPSLGYALPKPGVQLFDAGIYNIYAVDVQGCVSDTVQFNFRVLAGVTAGFNFKVSEGCEQDTVKFLNSSMGHNTSIWDFGDNTPQSTDSDPVHYYAVPSPNNAARTYTVTLAIANGQCADTFVQTVELNHPLVADYSTDLDSICLGTEISFTNNSIVKPGTVPKIDWYFGDGTGDFIFDTKHTYEQSGIYYPKLVVKDVIGCADSMIKEIVVDKPGWISFTTDRPSVCIGDDIRFLGEYSEEGARSVMWEFGDGITATEDNKPLHSYLEEGTYKVRYSIDYRLCPDLSYDREVVIKPFPKVYLGEDTAICPDGRPVYLANLAAPANPGIVYNWNNPTRDVTPGITVRYPGIYALTANLDGCIAADTVEVKKDCYINIPNAFTPNGDGHSDYFLPRQVLAANVTGFNMEIFNRWGEKIYHSAALDGRGWDGKYGGEDQPVGVYVYVIQVQFGNGVSEKYTGNVTLVR